jgi:hypothetical protein
MHLSYAFPTTRTHPPAVTWERVEKMLAPMLAKINVTPTLLTMNSGYWNLEHTNAEEHEDMNMRAALYKEGWQEYYIPTMRRLFPQSHMAFRNTPYAPHSGGRLRFSRIIGLMNTLLAEQSRRWGIPIYDHNALSLGMNHMYSWDKFHHDKELALLYFDSVLYRIAHMPALPWSHRPESVA